MAVTSSCNIDEDITNTPPPKIVLDSANGIYTVKQGREITIAPTYESAEGASYRWTMDGELIGSEPTLIFSHSEVGKYYITLLVATETGSDEEEIRVDVVELEIPTVSIAGNKSLTVAIGTEVKLKATVRETSLPTSFAWLLNDTPVSEELDYTFTADALGDYTLTAKADNADGSFSDSVAISVVRAEDIPFEWTFGRTTYHTVEGRKLLIAPTTKSADEGVAYSWLIESESEAAGHNSDFVFTAQSAGEYIIVATAATERGGNHITLTHEFTVTVYEEGKFYRAKSASSKADWNKIYEYTPAPGQFINETKTGGFDSTHTTPEAAIAYAEARMSETDSNGNPTPIWVSLGGFGGYIVMGFDHSIDNTNNYDLAIIGNSGNENNAGDYDLAVLGNSFSGSSEPGVVWVMQDENGNGEPDDTWYELAGSETGKAETIQNYAVTYYRPSGAGMPVQWTDNQGNSGEIDYLKQFHRQEYYYPLWVTEESYTLTGTCLKARNYDASGNGSYWVNSEYDWGYADNFSPIDRLSNDDNTNADVNANHFKISRAIDFEGNPVNLQYIDFVKVQCAVNAKSGWLGELSTEVCGAYDYTMKK